MQKQCYAHLEGQINFHCLAKAKLKSIISVFLPHYSLPPSSCQSQAGSSISPSSIVLFSSRSNIWTAVWHLRVLM